MREDFLFGMGRLSFRYGKTFFSVWDDFQFGVAQIYSGVFEELRLKLYLEKEQISFINCLNFTHNEKGFKFGTIRTLHGPRAIWSIGSRLYRFI